MRVLSRLSNVLPLMRRTVLFTPRIPATVMIATHAPTNRTPLTTPKKEPDTPPERVSQILTMRIEATMLVMMGPISQLKS